MSNAPSEGTGAASSRDSTRAPGSPLSERETIETLEWVSWGQHHFSGLAAGNRREELETLAEAGLVQCMGWHPVCDEDGFLKDPEEHDYCYVLTIAGRAMLDAEEDRRTKEWSAQHGANAAREARDGDQSNAD